MAEARKDPFEAILAQVGERPMEKQEKKAAMLIVDDGEKNRSILTQLFRDTFDITEAVNGKTALARLNEKPVDVILLDTVMPVMDGFELLSEIKRDERFAGIPVVMMISPEESGSEARALELGALDFITRPFHPLIAAARVRNAMARVENEWRKIEQTAQLRQISEMRRQIERDPLTGLYGRESFCRRTAERLRQESKAHYAIACFDISFFKAVNDLFGMEIGNLVLRTAGAYLRHTAAGVGLAGRLTADRFALCLPREMAEIDTILEGLEGAVKSLSIPHRIRFYAGVYQVEDTALPVEQMCDCANMALAEVKGSHSRRWALYDEEMQEKIREAQMIRREMDFALENGQFSIYVQPVRSLRQDCDIGGEVLTRWIHPVYQMIEPERFISLFERSGFIRRLDRFACEEACRFLAAEKQEFGQALPLSVNISRLDFYDDGLLDFFKNLVAAHGLSPSLLRLEITEHTYAENPRQIIRTVQSFRAEGFPVFVDGFGSGRTSSLNLLRNLAVDGVKIAMSFVPENDPARRGETVLKNLLTMAADLDMMAVIKGVETEEQTAFLRSIGGDAVQGYFFAPPMTGEDYRRRLQERVGEGIACWKI